MKRKLLIGLAAFLALVVAFGLYVTLVINKRSPPDAVAFHEGSLDVKVTYHRPYKKGRLIFGEEAAGALVPWGSYWRLGANESTEITFGGAGKIAFGDKAIGAGTYRMYAIPGPMTWQVVLNSELGRWGKREADHAKDVLTIEVPVDVAPTETEQFTITVAPSAAGAVMSFAWDKTAVHIPMSAPFPK